MRITSESADSMGDCQSALKSPSGYGPLENNLIFHEVENTMVSALNSYKEIECVWCGYSTIQSCTIY